MMNEKKMMRKLARRHLRRHADLDKLLPALGPVREPSSRQEELEEKMDSMFMFDYKPGMDFEDGVWILEREMQSWRVSPRGPTGRYLFEKHRS